MRGPLWPNKKKGRCGMFHQPRFPWNKGISLSYLNVRIAKVVVRCFALGRLEISLPRLSCGQWCLCFQDLGHCDQSTGEVFKGAFSDSGSLKTWGLLHTFFHLRMIDCLLCQGTLICGILNYVLFSMGSFLAYFCRFENNQMLPCLSRLYLGNMNKQVEKYNP